MGFLFIDDEFDITRLLKAMFRKEAKEDNLVFYFANSAQEAHDLLKSEAGTNIVLIVSDINMPNKTGVEFFRDIKNDHPKILKYFCSAYDDEGFYKEMIDLEVKAYFKKPIRIDDMKILLEKDLNEEGFDVKFFYK